MKVSLKGMTKHGNIHTFTAILKSRDDFEREIDLLAM